MLRSLRGRLVLLLLLLVVAAAATAMLMIGLFHQSAAARVGQAAAENSRACEAIVTAYRQYASGGDRSQLAGDDTDVRKRLVTLVQSALQNRPGVQGGIWQRDVGSVAFAFPTYDGPAARLEPPGGELPRIRDINVSALNAERPASGRYDARSQTLLIAACPLPGPIPHLTAWTMTWTFMFAGRSYLQLMAGQAVLLVTVLLAAALLIHLTMTWSRHVSQIESALNAYDVADLPVLPPTRERELDRIVLALNDAGRRLSAARQRGDELARQMATAERLAAIGRVAAGVAHEIRNPIAAMRLKAESAVAGGPERQPQALQVILGEIERLDTLVRRLLSITEHDTPKREQVEVRSFLQACVAQHVERAAARGVTLACAADAQLARFDPDQLKRALDNLILNALNAAPADSRIEVVAIGRPEALVLSVRDQGAGPPHDIADHLFEPFVTGRPDGTGLGLSIVREVAEAHGGAVRYVITEKGTSFEITLPWLTS
ncbi:signal transduction histidine kinase [Paraburkholderia sp. GAS199]|uniref:sensor histidine kinase n=1 Tax=Paraburkholderia sp. GAS199 TaxID=3035126 RepID=UPI003D20F98F